MNTMSVASHWEYSRYTIHQHRINRLCAESELNFNRLEPKLGRLNSKGFDKLYYIVPKVDGPEEWKWTVITPWCNSVASFDLIWLWNVRKNPNMDTIWMWKFLFLIVSWFFGHVRLANVRLLTSGYCRSVKC